MTASKGGWGPAYKKAAVSFTFDNLGEAADLEMGTWPQGQAVGQHYSAIETVPALLEHLGNIPVTFFIEGWNANIYPNTLRAIADAGREIGVHGWGHEIWTRLNETKQSEVMDRTLEAMGKLGIHPGGFRPPGGGGTENLPYLMRKFGLRYFSAVGSQDTVENQVASIPFLWRHVDGVFLEPAAANMVGVTLEDGQEFSLESMENVFRADIAEAVAEGSHTVFVFHPWLLGKNREHMETTLRLMEDMRHASDIWVASCGEVADWLVAKTQGAS